MSYKPWTTDWLFFIGKVVTITCKGKTWERILILNIDLKGETVFFQRDKGNGRRGLIKFQGEYLELDDLNETPAKQVPIPSSLKQQQRKM